MLRWLEAYATALNTGYFQVGILKRTVPRLVQASSGRHHVKLYCADRNCTATQLILCNMTSQS